jgi:hypothetical protein
MVLELVDVYTHEADEPHWEALLFHHNQEEGRLYE